MTEVLDRSGHKDWRALADPEKIIWLKVNEIRFKLTRPLIHRLQRTPMAVADGDWDFSKSPLEKTPKYAGIIQHFRDGVEWDQTILFARYAIRLANGETPCGCSSIPQLAQTYRKHVDSLFVSMQRNGFLLPRQRGKRTNIDLAQVYIGRGGEILFGNSGNHRLALAIVLGMEFYPCMVLTRHADWQSLREKAFSVERRRRREVLGPKLAEHPDMADLVQSPLRNWLAKSVASVRPPFFGRRSWAAAQR